MYRTLIVLVLLWHTTNAQQSDSLVLRIVDEKICYNKKTSVINFTYFFENHGHERQVVLNHYEPCFGEAIKLMNDTNHTQGIILQLLDDSGRVMVPELTLDSSLLPDYMADSLAFLEKNEIRRNRDFKDFTRVLRKTDQLYNLYYIKMNKKKCLHKAKFQFDETRKYTLRLQYITKDDVKSLADKGAIGKEDSIFQGILTSNEVPLCFR